MSRSSPIRTTRQGLSTSLKAGIARAAARQCDGALVLLGDMPQIARRPSRLRYRRVRGRATASWCPSHMRAARQPRAVAARKFFAEMLQLERRRRRQALARRACRPRARGRSRHRCDLRRRRYAGGAGAGAQEPLAVGSAGTCHPRACPARPEDRLIKLSIDRGWSGQARPRQLTSCSAARSGSRCPSGCRPSSARRRSRCRSAPRPASWRRCAWPRP